MMKKSSRKNFYHAQSLNKKRYTVQNDNSFNTDVLVVGAGPVGLTLAINLLRQGLRVRIVDKSEGPSPRCESKALIVHWRSLEILDEMGCLDEVVQNGIRLKSRTLLANGKVIADVPYISSARTFYSPAISIGQSQAESILQDQLAKVGGTVEYGVELMDFTNREEDVTAMLHQRVDAQVFPEECKAKYLVGCDGAQSLVRDKVGINFYGSPIVENVIMGDFDIEWTRLPDHIVHFFHENFVITVIPFPDDEQSTRSRYRAIVTEIRAPVSDTNDKKNTQSGQSQDSDSSTRSIISQDVPDIETFQKYFDQVCSGAKLSNPTWLVKHRISLRLADKYREGRVFLAGDAAHIHSLVEGYGMNLGLQDAYNLAWKLNLVLTDQSPSSLLDTYQLERRSSAEISLYTTAQLTKILFTKSSFMQKIRNNMWSFSGGNQNFQALSQLDVLGYPSSSILKNDGSPFLSRGPKVGGKALDASLASGQKLFKFVQGYSHTILLFCSKQQFSKSFNHMERIALQVERRYATEEDTDNCLTVYIVIPHGCSPTYKGALIQDNDQNDLYTTYGIGDATEIFIIRPDGYIGYHCQPADADKILQYLQTLFI